MKIAIVGANDSVNKVFEIGKKFYKNIEFVPYRVGISDKSDPILKECENNADGVIFTGLGFVTVSKKLTIPHEFISRDGSCIMKVFWNIKKNKIKPNRVSIDIVNRDLVEDICEEFGMYFKNLYVFPYDSDISEIEILNEHKKLWNKGLIDSVITSYGWIYEELKKEKTPVIRLEITTPIIRNSIDTLIYKIENQNIMKSQIAVQIVEIDAKQDFNRYEYDLLRKRNYIESMLIDYLPIIQGTVSQDSANQYRIITNRGAIENDFAKEAFIEILNITIKENIKIVAGAGFGHTAFDADFNARIAMNKSRETKDSSYFIVDDKKRISGPIGSDDNVVYDSRVVSDEINKISKETGLSATYISKIDQLSKNLDGEFIDSKKLAELLSISDRSARRVLKKLSDAGYASIVTASQTNTVGRPTNVYKLNIQK